MLKQGSQSEAVRELALSRKLNVHLAGGKERAASKSSHLFSEQFKGKIPHCISPSHMENSKHSHIPLNQSQRPHAEDPDSDSGG